MNAVGGKTCRYCQHWGNSGCPFYKTNLKKKIDEPACGQHIPLRDVSKFKERKGIDQVVIDKQEEKKKVSMPNRRSIEF